MRVLGAELSRLAAQSIYGMPPAEWIGSRRAALDAWIARGATASATLLDDAGRNADARPQRCPLMPVPTRDALLAVIVAAHDRDPDFARAPTWNGLPSRPGHAREHRHPFVAALVERNGHAATTRFVARLVDLAAGDLPDQGRVARRRRASVVQAFAVGTADGLAAVQTARGLLVHRVRIDAGRVGDYRIVAPTEWNFHPTGALASGLAGLAAPTQARAELSARLAVQALDPCVACRVEVADA